MTICWKFAQLLLMVLLLSSCANKKYGYTYLDDSEATGKANVVPFKANDFNVSLMLVPDTILLDKTKSSPFKVHVKLSGQYQFWPENIEFKVWCNDVPVPFKVVEKRFSVSSVINGKVKYMDATTPEFNIPLLIEDIRKEYSLPDSAHYFMLTSVLESEPVVQKENAKIIEVKANVKWKGGSKLVEKIFRLAKIDITKYPVRSRLYG